MKKHKTNIVLYGGSFDPVHIGHVKVAEFVQNEIDASKVIFIPAKQSPLKKNAPTANEQQRFDMLKLATKYNLFFEVDDCEYERPSPSYTFDTVTHFRERFGSDHKLIWLVGADVISDLGNWYRIDDLLAICDMAVMCRASYPMPDLTALKGQLDERAIQMLERNIIETPEYHISSTEIRQRIACNQPVDDMVSPDVCRYIKDNKLYCK